MEQSVCVALMTLPSRLLEITVLRVVGFQNPSLAGAFVVTGLKLTML